jgi:hypothetical protein
MHISNENVEWLLQGPPWVEYRTRLDLLDQSENAPEVSAARGAMKAHPLVKDLIAKLEDWPGPALTRHNDAKHPIHKLVLLADLGFRKEDPEISGIIDRVFAHQSAEGPIQVKMNINPRYGGTGEDKFAWMLCDAPLVLYALVKFGYGDDERVQAGVNYLNSLVRENGWPCAAAPEFGKFRGPGPKTAPCPYANLIMLRLLAALPDQQDSEAAHIGADILLRLWDARKEQKPYLFAMGTHFARLKAPLIWYDILHVLEVLTQYPWVREDQRVQALATIVRTLADEDKRFVPGSVWMAWKAWDFGQKREPSPWLSLLTYRMLSRLS